MVFIRILIAIIIFGGIGVITFDYLYDSGIIAAIRQFFVWAWRIFVRFFFRGLAMISKPAALWFKKMLNKFVMRKAFQFVLRFITPVVIGVLIGIFGETKYQQWESKLDTKKKAFADKLISAINNDYFASLPNWLRIVIAIGIIAGVVKLFFIVQNYAGPGYAFIFSMIAGIVVEKLPLIGLDKLIEFIVKRSAPIRAFGMKHRWIRWVWLGPLLDWFSEFTKEKGQEAHEKREQKKDAEVIEIITEVDSTKV